MKKEINKQHLQEISSFLADLQTSLDDESVKAVRSPRHLPLSANPNFDQEKFDQLIGSLSEIMAKSSSAATDQEPSIKEKLVSLNDQEKRQLALETADAQILSLLAEDENFHVRTLALCNANMPADTLSSLIDYADDYTLMIISHNPNIASSALDRVFARTDQGITGEDEILNGILGNPQASQSLKFQVEQRLAQM